MNLSKFISSKTGKSVMSIILGLGLATLFRRVCKDNKCLVYKTPPLEDIKDKVFQYEDKCYTYEPTSMNCDSKKTNVVFA